MLFKNEIGISYNNNHIEMQLTTAFNVGRVANKWLAIYKHLQNVIYFFVESLY